MSDLPDSMVRKLELACARLDNIWSMENSLHEFVKGCWPIISGGYTFQDGWAVEAICEHLEAVERGDIKRLLINLPPRTGKSLVCSVAFPVWLWLRNPALNVMNVAYVDDLSQRDNVKSRRLVQSGWFQNNWGQDRIRLASDQNTKDRMTTTAGGDRLAVSIMGGITGDGADVLIVDDPNSASARSSTVLDRTNEIFSVTLPTRFNDMKTGRQVVIQQRVHENDVSGFILSEEKHDYVHLMLPMEFEPDRACETIVLPSSAPNKWRDPREEAGELLIPERVGLVELDRLKRALRQAGGEYEVAGQLQQRPAPAEGGIVKRGWFKRWTDAAPPECDMVVQVWDTAVSEKKEAAYSATQTGGLFDTENGRGAILLGAFRDRMEFPKLYATVKLMGNDYRIKVVTKNQDEGWTADRMPDGKCVPDVIIIEAKSSGQSLLQSIRRLDFPKASVIGFNPTKYGDKVSRMRKITHLVEGGSIYLPEKVGQPGVLRAHAKEFEDEISVFPQGTSKDVGDVFSMALTWMMERGLLSSALESISYVTEADDSDTVVREQAIY